MKHRRLGRGRRIVRLEVCLEEVYESDGPSAKQSEMFGVYLQGNRVSDTVEVRILDALRIEPRAECVFPEGFMWEGHSG